MVKYFKELENKKEYSLPLIDDFNNGIVKIVDYEIPVSFIEKYADLFKDGKALINICKNFDANKWFQDNPQASYNKYIEVCEELSELENIIAEYMYTLEEYEKIDFKSDSIRNYLEIIEKLSSVYTGIFQHNRDYYTLLNKKVSSALDELEKYSTIKYEYDKGVYQFEADEWYITPNNNLYNPGLHKPKARNIIIKPLLTNDIDKNMVEKYKLSNKYIEEYNNTKEKGYITRQQFNHYIRYINHPMYLEEINHLQVTREKHVVDLVLGIISGWIYYEKFFEDLELYTAKPKDELDKLMELTNNDISYVLVRCYGFHKVESMVDKTITTSLINYEEEFEEYIKKGWNIVFIPPIIIDKKEKCLKESGEIKKVLKK